MQDDKSIEQLENDIWTDTDFPTGLVERCYQYRKIPLKDLTVEQIRTLLGQSIGVEFLLPKALDILKTDILAEADFYPGDLLFAVIHIKEWPNSPLKQEFKNFLVKKIEYIQSVIEGNEHRQILKQINAFLAS